jgi:hypothetical protein
MNSGLKHMIAQKKFILIPLVIIFTLIIYRWTIILTTDVLATWRHYLGLVFFILLAFLFFKSVSTIVIATGLYLLLATLDVFAITAAITISWFRIWFISTPPFQLLSFGLFILYLILNGNTLIDIYLGYKETKQIKIK